MTSNVLPANAHIVEPHFDSQTEPTLKDILSRHAEASPVRHQDLMTLHKRGFRNMQPVYLSDGTMLTDTGGSTLVQHPDNRLAVVFNYNPDKVRRVKDKNDKEGLARLNSTEGLIVIDARECDSPGLVKEWVNDAVMTHNVLISNSNTFHGILKRTTDNEWRSESISYNIASVEGGNNEGAAVLSCGYGLGLAVLAISDKEKFQKKLLRWRARLTRDKIVIDKKDAYPIMHEHFGKIAPKVMQGFNPHHVTFEEGNETEFSKKITKKIDDKGLVRKHWGKTCLKTALIASTLVGLGFMLASGVVRTFKFHAINNLIKSTPATALRLLGPKSFTMLPAAGAAAAFFAIYFLSHTFANAKQQQIWTLKDMEDVSSSFYEKQKAEVLSRRYQTADSKQIEDSRALNVEEYDFLPADAKTYKREPAFYSLHRLFSTKSVREGSLMEAFTLNGHDISYYDESHGIRRVVIPALKTAFVTYAHVKEGELEVSKTQKRILDSGEVIQITEDPETRKLKKEVISYDEYEKRLANIIPFSDNETLISHPAHEEYMARQASEKEAAKLTNRIRNKIGTFNL
jgi:hypothetical protein